MTSKLLERLGVVSPVVQAGMGGLPAGELAAVVSEAGGLGTIGWLPVASLRDELMKARSLTSRPISINLTVPQATQRHWQVANDADLVVTHWESVPQRRVDKPWLHTVGSVDEAQAAIAAGADGIVVQGVEAGGHVRGKVPALELLGLVRAAIPPDSEIFLAGGIADADDVRRALAAGATATALGTRFLASDECPISTEYQRRVVEGSETILTELFGLGWPHAPHRVLPNAATRRWLHDNSLGPSSIRRLHAVVTPLVMRLPARFSIHTLHSGSSSPLALTAQTPSDTFPARALEKSPLYAGETVARIHDVRPAAELVRDLTP
ncbi:NAD(P)H-dependent flavin oxidoreductase YrpB (nitropropane dioxygenase family) [Aeromicrobium panaciterrae]|uniref:NAD(P)H-dependent flavin oxidoreductase YrpB (Nitropropane dioxygenase family) n=1 Tax=Aeromicrobium panaciterrae TaxID=363861 RepID=A0ABU1URT0_9ACTN|nr:nitronate monooxygenase [Aeromicrobium panaciterrae]MDR7087897.1 NAD(P)H-dependent flavin oxidoreductase YrpB (nitropropane dioxygenase family) [Aeromicrobium panaciterrae]